MKLDDPDCRGRFLAFLIASVFQSQLMPNQPGLNRKIAAYVIKTMFQWPNKTAESVVNDVLAEVDSGNWREHVSQGEAAIGEYERSISRLNMILCLSDNENSGQNRIHVCIRNNLETPRRFPKKMTISDAADQVLVLIHQGLAYTDIMELNNSQERQVRLMAFVLGACSKATGMPDDMKSIGNSAAEVLCEVFPWDLADTNTEIKKVLKELSAEKRKLEFDCGVQSIVEFESAVSKVAAFVA